MATSKEMSMSKEMGMSRDMGMSMQGVGHLYMQTNEARNCIIDYTRSANGAFAEVERVETGGAGSGLISPIYHISRPKHFSFRCVPLGPICFSSPQAQSTISGLRLICGRQTR
jgi:hypothetical protein